MEELRGWLLGVTACALLVSLAEQVSDGAMRRIVRLIGGVLLSLALLAPLSGAELSLPDLAEAEARQEQLARRFQEDYEEGLCRDIAAEMNAYVERKASALGCTVRAQCAVQMSGGVPTIVGITLYGDVSPALSSALAEELGIAKEKQEWIQKSA